MKRIFYIYAHYTADSNELFYIGKGKGKRLSSRYGRNKLWNYIANKHGFIFRKIVDGLEENEAFRLEIEKIKEFSPRANFTKGGSGGFTGLNSGNFKKGFRPWNTGMKFPQMSIRQMGENNPAWGKPSPRRKEIICLTDGSIFQSVKHASEYYNIGRAFIQSCLAGKCDSAKGREFRYKKEELNIKPDNLRNSRRIIREKACRRVQCIETGAIYPSIQQCSRSLGVQASNLYQVLTGKRKKTGGLTFRFF